MIRMKEVPNLLVMQLGLYSSVYDQVESIIPSTFCFVIVSLAFFFLEGGRQSCKVVDSVIYVE